MALWSMITDGRERHEVVEEEEIEEQKPQWNLSAKSVGIDLGYGFVKILQDDHEVKFPSVVGLGSQLKFQSGLNPLAKPIDHMSISVDDKTYFVGNLAVKQSEIASRSLDQDRVGDLNTKILLLTSLGIVSQWDEQTFNLITGLPTNCFGGYKDEWDKNLKGSYRVSLRQGDKVQHKNFKIANVKIIPQPFGTLYNQMLNEYGAVADSELSEKNVAVVDIGFKTTDFVVADSMEYVERLSSCTTTALSSAYRMIANRLRDEFKVDKENFELDQIVEKGELRLAGRKLDINQMKQEAFEQVALKIITEIESLWDYRDFDAIFLTGGGGQALSNYL
ncbi:MAG: ParM/StbA family protein, partial [Bacillota bacterium]|nr:ParM/StbA family protein [Bacillota bacterium]